MRIIRFFLLVTLGLSQTFTLEGDASSIIFKGDTSYTLSNQDLLSISDSSDISALEFTSSDTCSMDISRRLIVHGNLLASTQKSFQVQGYEQWKLVLVEDFQGKISGWSRDDISNCGTSPDLFLGGYCKFGNTVVSKTFKLPAHNYVKIQLTLHFLDRWEGESVYMKVDNKLVMSESYQACNNLHSSMCQNKGIDVCGDDFPDRMGYSARFTGKHSGSSLALEFSSNIKKDPCSASWGIDDLQVFIK